MPKKKTTKEFIKTSLKKHGTKYDYSKSNYVNTRTKILVTCTHHGDFAVLPRMHVAGGNCPRCMFDKKIVKFETFLEKSKIIHKNKYDYSQVEWKRAVDKIKIKCPVHGVFEQIAYDHMIKYGCQKCAPITIGLKSRGKVKNVIGCGWTPQSYKKRVGESTYLYIIEIAQENLIKVSVSVNGAKRRFNRASNFPYQIKILEETSYKSDFLFALERKIRNKFKDYRKLPNKKFSGWKECFDSTILKDIKDYILNEILLDATIE